MDERVAVASGVELRVLRWPGRSPGFLLVHGLASNALLWTEVAEHLSAEGHQAIAVDLRGHGLSTVPAEGFDTATAAGDLAAVADHHGLSHLIVAGQSWGGNVVVRLAATRPDLVAGLALVDGGWINLPADFASWDECATALRPPDLDGAEADDLRELLRKAHRDWSDRAVEATLASLRELPDGTLARRLPIPQHMRIVRGMWDDPPLSYLPRITAPTVLIPAIPADEARAARKRAAVAAAERTLGGPATIREYVGGDHDLHAQHPVDLATDLLALAQRSGARLES